MIKPSALTILNKPTCLEDINSIILFGNEFIYLNSYINVLIKNLFPEITTLSKKKDEYEYKDNNDKLVTIEYEYSNYHYEMNFSEKHLRFIKSIIKNKNITGRKYIFVLKNFDNSNRESQHAIARILEKNNAKFFILSNSLSKLSNAIKSRSMHINLSFPREKMETFVGNKPIIGSLILTIANITEKTKLELAMDDLFKKITKSKNELENITAIREYCYKIYHLCVPFEYIAKLTIHKYSQHKKISDIVSIAAECDHLLTIGSKDLLLYETFFIKLYKLLN